MKSEIKNISTEELIAELKKREEELKNPDMNYRRVVGIMDDEGIESFIDADEMDVEKLSHRFFAMKLRTRYVTNRNARFYTTWLPKVVCDVVTDLMKSDKNVEAMEMIKKLPNLKYLGY